MVFRVVNPLIRRDCANQRGGGFTTRNTTDSVAISEDSGAISEDSEAISCNFRKIQKNRVKSEDFDDEIFLYVLMYPETQFHAIKPRFHVG